MKKLEQLEAYKVEIEHLQEQVESMSKQHKDKLHSLSDQMISKSDLAKAEKRSALKMNILLGVVVVEAILIGIKFFM